MVLRAKSLILLAFLVIAGCAAIPAGWILVPTKAAQHGPRVIEIPPHLGVRGIGRHLADHDMIRSPVTFVALTTVRGTARKLRAGEYSIPRDASMLTILSMLEDGRVVQHPVLFPEGSTVLELASLLEGERLASAEAITRLARDPKVLARLGVEAPSVEGYVFPDTYHFVRGMMAEEILARMVQRLRSKVTPAHLEQARARGLTLHTLLTLASVVEREAAAHEERPIIAAVFWNRLKRNMPLQADPTVQYAVGKERRALTRADLAIDHPYNTYRHAGLPPGPIASPGLASIEAVLNPASVSYLYFVAMDDRRHAFSNTLEEHNAAVVRYRLARDR